MSQDDSLVRNFLIQAMKSRPFFWDKSREDFNNFKSVDTSKKEWLDILEEVGVNASDVSTHAHSYDI